MTGKAEDLGAVPPPRAPPTPDQHAKAPQQKASHAKASSSCAPQPDGEVEEIATPHSAYDAQLELLLLRQRLAAVLEAKRAALGKLRCCRREIVNLHTELRERCSAYERRLAVDEQLRAEATRTSAAFTATLRADNERLAAEVQLLQRQLAQLEADASEALCRRDQLVETSEGTELLIAALQIEVASLQQESQQARRARLQAEVSRDALQQQADILRLQVEHMAAQIDAGREENGRV